MVEQNRFFLAAYGNFLSRLSNYRDTLPTRHHRELSNLTCEIYNEINVANLQFNKAARITLPSTVHEGIRIAFADDPGRELDALQVLSEGHVRCLGLAILLAKNIHLGCPVVIFDNVVNAIDDDHRGGIRKLVFKHPRLEAKQIILTTHAEQFVKELEQELPVREYDRCVGKLTFLPDRQERRIRVKHDSQQNYLHRAEEAIKESRWSDVLYNCRCCVENLAHKLWRKLGNRRFKTEFQVTIREPNGVPDLMSVVESLNSFLKKPGNKAGEFEPITKILDFLIGIQAKSKVVWSYLNKGTHEEEGRHDFDRLMVTEIVAQLGELDACVKSL